MIEAVAAGFFFLVVVAYVVRMGLSRVDNDMRSHGSPGDEQGWHVEVLSDAIGRRHVGLTTDLGEGHTVRACPDAAKARQLAGMLRLAASPGKNLMQARRRLRESAAPPLKP